MVDPTNIKNKPNQQAAKINNKINKNPRQHSQNNKATDDENYWDTEIKPNI